MLDQVGPRKRRSVALRDLIFNTLCCLVNTPLSQYTSSEYLIAAEFAHDKNFNFAHATTQTTISQNFNF